MPHRAGIVIALLACAGCSRQDDWQTRSRSAPPNVLAQGVIDEVNAARTTPETYAKRLESRRPFYNERTLTLPGHPPVKTEEGVEGLNETVEALADAEPVGAVTWSSELAKVAREVGRTIGPAGLTADAAPAPRAGVMRCIAFGSSEPDAVVARLLIDDGVPNRRDRAALLNPDMKYAGAACGPHARYGTMCVIDLAREAVPESR